MDPAPVNRHTADVRDAVRAAVAELARYLSRIVGQEVDVAEARSAHDRFAVLQAPERLQGGTLSTGGWRRDRVFAEWEREATATPT
jgi:hypothetical protein